MYSNGLLIVIQNANANENYRALIKHYKFIYQLSYPSN